MTEKCGNCGELVLTVKEEFTGEVIFDDPTKQKIKDITAELEKVLRRAYESWMGFADIQGGTLSKVSQVMPEIREAVASKIRTAPRRSRQVMIHAKDKTEAHEIIETTSVAHQNKLKEALAIACFKSVRPDATDEQARQYIRALKQPGPRTNAPLL